MVSLSMTLSDPSPGFQGHGSFKRRVSPKRRILQTQLLYRTLTGNHRHASIFNLAIQFTTPLLLCKPCTLFASVVRVCQRQVGFLVSVILLTSVGVTRFLIFLFCFNLLLLVVMAMPGHAVTAICMSSNIVCQWLSV